MAKRRKEKPREDTPQRAARLAREAAERKRRNDLWVLWSFLLVLVVATVLHGLDGYRVHGHLHLHGGLIICDVALLGTAMYMTLTPTR